MNWPEALVLIALIAGLTFVATNVDIKVKFRDPEDKEQ